MIKDDNSDGESRDLGMDELQFDDIDSMLVPESSSEPSGLEDLSIDPLESLVASSGEEYPSSFENDFYFHPEEASSASSDPSLEDLESPLVDVEIDKLLDVGDFPDSSKISNLESDDSFFNSGDSAPDEGMDFSELDSYLTEESDDMEEFDLSDQEGNPLREDDFLNEEDPIALSELKEIVSTDESQGDDSIAFSGSELDDILNTEPSAVTNFAEDENDLPDFITHSDFDEDEGTIALSDDELGNLLASESEEPISSFGSEDTSFEVEDEESIALSEDELGNLLTSESEEPVSSFGTEESSFEVEDEEPIALSEDELGNLLSDDSNMGTDGFEDTGSMFKENESPSLPAEQDLGGPDEFGLEEAPSDSSVDFESNEFFPEPEGEDKESIALSEEELGNLLSSEDTFASAKEEDLNEILGELPLVSDLDAFDSIDDDVSKEEVTRVAPTTVNEDEMIIVLDEYADEEKSSPIEELRKTPDQSETPIQGDASGETPSKEEMKRIMTYLDELLGNLPDDLIREFSRSDYFELYKKLMKQIGV
ncbi:hypothetical protein LEP1GSC169_2794 [Leptospira santarosai str. HAI1349]|nr:hypothetical protein LEP1GSC169_2794 [Leptospira santarosai str. HAI1349]